MDHPPRHTRARAPRLRSLAHRSRHGSSISCCVGDARRHTTTSGLRRLAKTTFSPVSMSSAHSMLARVLRTRHHNTDCLPPVAAGSTWVRGACRGSTHLTWSPNRIRPASPLSSSPAHFRRRVPRVAVPFSTSDAGPPAPDPLSAVPLSARSLDYSLPSSFLDLAFT